MRNALRAFLLLAAGSADAAVADEPSAESRAFVEVVAPRDAYFVHEVIRLRVRFGIDADYLRTNVVPMFQRSLDVPVQLQAPWTRELPGTIALVEDPASPVDGPRRVSFALDDGAAAAMPVADVTRDGRKFAVWEIERSYLPERPGGLSIPAPTLRFAYATQFEDEFVHGRVATNRRDATVRGAALALTIRALPDDGRPPEFTGAVGRFNVTADVDRRDVAACESIKLTLRIEGAGDLAHFDAPRLDGIARVHVLGMIEDTNRARRVVTYDIAPLDEGVTEAPSIPFAYFDPGPPAGYRVARTAAIPLRVRARPGSDRRPIVPSDATENSNSSGFVMGAVVVAGSIAVLAMIRRRARVRGGIDADRARVRAAAGAFRTHAADPRADLADAFAAFLAECLRCPTAAVITPDLAARLVRAGVPADLAARTATLLESLVATRYGGGAGVAAAVTDARALVDDLESAFESVRSS